MAGSDDRPAKTRKLEPAVKDRATHPQKHSSIVGLPVEARVESVPPPSMAKKSEDGYDQPPDTKDVIHEPISDGLQGRDKNQNQSEQKSRNELKRVRKKQEWEAGREDRKARRKEKLKEKKARKVQERAAASLDPDRKAMLSDDPRRKNHQARPIQVPVTFVIDCNFDDLMTEPEMISLGSQLTRSYSDNKGSLYRAHLVISSFAGKLKQRFETVLANHHLGWKGVKFTDEDFLAAARHADGIMRGSQGGRLIGALTQEVDLALLTAQPLRGVSSNVKIPIKVQQPQTTSDVLSETGEGCHGGNLPEAPQVPILTSTETHSESHDKLAFGDSHFSSNEFPAQSSIMDLRNNLTDIDPPCPSLVSVPAPTPTITPSLIYLTSDSPNTLTHLSPYTSYIIGGLVDKNRHKGLCYKRATALGIHTAKLPIGEYMTMQSRTVLATNHVVEIMVRWLEEGDWGKAFLKVIPKRKEARLKVKEDEKGGGGDGKDEGENRGGERKRKRDGQGEGKGEGEEGEGGCCDGDEDRMDCDGEIVGVKLQ